MKWRFTRCMILPLRAENQIHSDRRTGSGGPVVMGVDTVNASSDCLGHLAPTLAFYEQNRHVVPIKAQSALNNMTAGISAETKTGN